MPRLPLQVEGNGFCRPAARVWQGHTATRCRARPVRGRARLDTDMPPLESCGCGDRTGREAGRGAPRRAEGDRSTERVDIGQRGAVDIQARVRGDIALLLRIAEKRRQIEVAYRQIAPDRLAGR